MGNLAVILALGALIIGSIVLWNGRRHTAAAQDESSAYAVERLAREAAQVGLQDALRELNDDVDHWPATAASARTKYGFPVTRAHGSGAYTVTLDKIYINPNPEQPDRVWLTATGTHDGYDAATGTTGTTSVVLKTVYETAKEDIGLPPAMRQAVQTEEDLTIKGNGCISGATHSNGGTSTTGITFDVLGSGTSAGSYSGSPASGAGQFTGSMVPSSDSVHIPTITFPPSSVTYTAPVSFTSLSTTTDPPYSISPPVSSAGAVTPLVNGWFGISGKGGAGIGNEYALYVPGNLTISGDVRLIGYSKIYVGGKLTIGGHAGISPVPPSVAYPSFTGALSCAQRMAAIKTWADTNLPNGQSTLAFYVNGDIDMDGNTNVVAHLWTNGAFNYTGGGNPDRLIIGGVTAQNDLELKGTTMIYYTEAGESVVPGGLDKGHDGLRLVAYNENAIRP